MSVFQDEAHASIKHKDGKKWEYPRNRENYCFLLFNLGSYVWLFATPWTVAHQASLSFTISWSLLILMSIKTVMPSNHLILCHPLLLPPSIFLKLISVESVRPSNHLILSPPALNFYQHQGLFQWVSGSQSIGASASASVLPMNIQGWFPLGLTGFISLQSKGLSRVISSTTIRKHQFFSAQPSLWSNSHICTWLLEKL